MSLDDQIHIWDEMFSRTWTAENGLARLVSKEDEDKNTEFPIHDQLGLETVKNDNGILFLAYFLALSHLAKLKERIYQRQFEFGTTIERLVRLPHRGLFNRQPAGEKMPEKAERHDNYIGIAAISKIFGFSFIQQIISYGVLNSWNFNNVEPKKFDIKAQRQPGDVCFYMLANNGSFEIIGFIHLIIGVTINAFKSDPGQNNLTWLRLYCLNLDGNQQPFIVRMSLIVVSAFWNLMMVLKWGSLGNMFKAYFGVNHPIVKMAYTLPEDKWGV